MNNIDIMLVTETHFTNKNFSMSNYKFYHTMHPDGTAHEGTVILIKNNIKHYVTNPFREKHIQATNVVVEDWTSPITFSTIYCLPKFNNKEEQFKSFFSTLGPRFMVGGDFNAKHVHWGSRLISPKGRELIDAINVLKLNVISTGQPTY